MSVENGFKLFDNLYKKEIESKLIFEKGFAFKTYEEAELACIKELIKIVKNKQ